MTNIIFVHTNNGSKNSGREELHQTPMRGESCPQTPHKVVRCTISSSPNIVLRDWRAAIDNPVIFIDQMSNSLRWSSSRQEDVTTFVACGYIICELVEAEFEANFICFQDSSGLGNFWASSLKNQPSWVILPYTVSIGNSPPATFLRTLALMLNIMINDGHSVREPSAVLHWGVERVTRDDDVFWEVRKWWNWESGGLLQDETWMGH